MEQDSDPLLERFDSISFEHTRKSISRLAYFSHYGIFIYNLARAFLIWDILPKTTQAKSFKTQLSFDFYKEFKKATGLSIKEYLILEFIQLGKLFQLDYKTNNPNDFMLPRDYLSQTTLPESKKNALYKSISQNVGEFTTSEHLLSQKGYSNPEIFTSDFMSLVEKPVINITDKYSIVSDPQYFEDRVANGPYWILHNKFKELEGDKSKKAQEFSAFYGHLHELYVDRILRELCSSVIQVKDRSNEGLKMCDYIGVIETEDDEVFLLVIECKKVAFSLGFTLLADSSKAVEELNKVFGEKGFGQIYSTIKLIQNNLLDEIHFIDKKKIRGVFPILITDRFIIEDPLNRNFYEKNFFNHQIDKHNPNGPLPLARPIFLSTEELELIEGGHKKMKKLSLLNFLLFRNESLDKRSYRAQKQFIPGIRLADIEEIVTELDTVWNTLYLIGYPKFPNNRLQTITKKRMRTIKRKLFPHRNY